MKRERERQRKVGGGSKWYGTALGAVCYKVPQVNENGKRTNNRNRFAELWSRSL